MSKLLTVLIKKLNGVKESSKDVTLDLSGGRESVYEDLLIPLINLTKSDDLVQLYNSLSIIINDSPESEAFTNIAELLIKYLMEDSKDDDVDADLYEEFDNLMLNCMAIFNSLKEAIDNDTISVMNKELTTYINSKFKIEHEDNNEESKEENNNAELKEDSLEEEDHKDESIKIISAKDEVNDDS